MQLISRLRVSTRLFGGFTFIFLLFGVNAVFTISALLSIQDGVEKLGSTRMPAALRAERMAFDVSQVQQFLTDVAATGKAEGLAEAEAAARDFRGSLAAFRGMEGGGMDAAQLKTLGERFEAFLAQGRRMAEAYLRDGTAAGNAIMAGFDAEAVELSGLVRQFREQHTVEAGAISSAVLAHVGDSRSLILAVGMAAMLAAVLVAGGLSRSIVSPLRGLQDFTRAIAGGNYAAALDGRLLDERSRSEVCALSQDVSGMVRELKERLGFCQGVLHGMSLPCFVVDTAERLSFLNPQALGFLELPGTPDEYLGKTLAEVFYGSPGRATITGRCLREGKGVSGLEAEVKTRKGSPRFVRLDASLLRNLDGRTTGAFVVIADVTDIHGKEVLIRRQHERISEAAAEAEAVAGRLSEAAVGLALEVEHVEVGANTQKERAAATATAMEQMSVSVMEVARNASDAAASSALVQDKAREASQRVEAVVAAIEEVAERTRELESDMAGLGKVAQDIVAILSVIGDIADQTNLLALNAAIEAARAGDAGRGFAVVADEVRKLAEKTMSATRQVEAAVTGIRGTAAHSSQATERAKRAVEASVAAARESGLSMQAILALAESASRQVAAIATASEEQSAASEEISRAMENITRISDETATGMSRSGRSVEELAEESGRLHGIIERMVGGAEEQASAQPTVHEEGEADRRLAA